MKYSNKTMVLLFAGLLWQSITTAQKAPQLGIDPIDAVINAMTVEEKAAMLTGTGMPGYAGLLPLEGESKVRVAGAAGGTFPIARLGIPETVVADGPAGLRIEPKRKNENKTYYATAFPVGTALAYLIYEI